jgi:hypothetical protein
MTMPVHHDVRGGIWKLQLQTVELLEKHAFLRYDFGVVARNEVEVLIT